MSLHAIGDLVDHVRIFTAFDMRGGANLIVNAKQFLWLFVRIAPGAVAAEQNDSSLPGPRT